MRSQTNNDWAEGSADNTHRPSGSDVGRYTDNSHSTSQDATRSQSREGRGSGSVPQAPSRRSGDLPRSGRGQRLSGVRMPDASPPPRLPIKYALERTSTAAFPGVEVRGSSAGRREAPNSASHLVYEDDSSGKEEDDADWSDATTDNGNGGVEDSSTRALVFDHDSSSRSNAAATTVSLSPTTKVEVVTRPTAIFGAPPPSSSSPGGTVFRRGTPVARVAYSAGYTPAAEETSEESSCSIAKSPSNPPAAGSGERMGFGFTTGSAAAAAETDTQPSFGGFGGKSSSGAVAKHSSFFQELTAASAAAVAPSLKVAVALPGASHTQGKKNEHPLDFPPSSASLSIFPKPETSTSVVGEAAAATAEPSEPFFGSCGGTTGPVAAASSPFSGNPFPPASSPSPFSLAGPSGRPQPSPSGAATANAATAESRQAARPYGFPSVPNLAAAFGPFTAPSCPAAGGAAAAAAAGVRSSLSGFKATPAFQGTEKRPSIVPTHAMGAPFGGGVPPAPADATLGNGVPFNTTPPITKSTFAGFGISRCAGGEAQPTCASAFQQSAASFPMSASVLPGATIASAKPAEHPLTFHPPTAAGGHFSVPVVASTSFDEAAAAATQAAAATPLVQPAFGGCTVPGLAAHGHLSNVRGAAVAPSPKQVGPAEPPSEAPPPRPADVFCFGATTTAASMTGPAAPPVPSPAEMRLPAASRSASSPQNSQRRTGGGLEQEGAPPSPATTSFPFSVDCSTLVASPVYRQSKRVGDDVSDMFDVDGSAVCAPPVEDAASTPTYLVAAGQSDTLARLMAHATKTCAAAERIVQAACEREEEEGKVVPLPDVVSPASPPQLVPFISSYGAANAGGGSIPTENTVAKTALPSASLSPAAVQVTITHIYNCTQDEQSWLQAAGIHAVPSRLLERARNDGLTSTPLWRAPATAPPRQQLEVALYCRPLLIHLPNPPLHTSLLCAAGQHGGLCTSYAVVRFVWRVLLPSVLGAVFSILFALLLVVTSAVVLDRVHAEYPLVALWVAEVRRYAQSVSVEGMKGWAINMATKVYP